MDDYKEQLRRLAVHDAALVEVIGSEEKNRTASALDDRTVALVRVAATIAVDAGLSSIQHAVSVALAAGASSNEIVATLEAFLRRSPVPPASSRPHRSWHSPSAMTSRKHWRNSICDGPLRNHAIRMTKAGGSPPIFPAQEG